MICTLSLRSVPARSPLTALPGSRFSSIAGTGRRRRLAGVIASALALGSMNSWPLKAAPGTPGAPAVAKPAAATPIPTGASPGPQLRGGLVTIESDQQQADNVTGVVTAIGNVRITYPDRGMVATARQAQYYTREGRLVLSGDVDVIDKDGQRLRAEQIVYLLNGQRLIALPGKGQQVQTRLRFDTKPGASTPRPLLP